jgi:hypothetical protein
MLEKERKRIEAIRRKIDRLDLICTGTLLERTKVCGKPNCRCATDPNARHGPYHEWNRREGGRLRHRAVSTDEAARIDLAMNDYQRLLEYLQQWEEESIRIILKR